jgi:hypothetical protein
LSFQVSWFPFLWERHLAALASRQDAAPTGKIGSTGSERVGAFGILEKRLTPDGSAKVLPHGSREDSDIISDGWQKCRARPMAWLLLN